MALACMVVRTGKHSFCISEQPSQPPWRGGDPVGHVKAYGAPGTISLPPPPLLPVLLTPETLKLPSQETKAIPCGGKPARLRPCCVRFIHREGFRHPPAPKGPFPLRSHEPHAGRECSVGRGSWRRGCGESLAPLLLWSTQGDGSTLHGPFAQPGTGRWQCGSPDSLFWADGLVSRMPAEPSGAWPSGRGCCDTDDVALPRTEMGSSRCPHSDGGQHVFCTASHRRDAFARRGCLRLPMRRAPETR